MLFLPLALLHTTAQTPVHDERLGEYYKYMLANEREMLVATMKWELLQEADRSRIKMLVEDLAADRIKMALEADIRSFFRDTYRTLKELDRSDGIVSHHFNKLGLPADQLRKKIFFLQKARHVTENNIKKVEKNITAYLDPQNYMPEGDRLHLIQASLLLVNYYVIQFALRQIEEFDGMEDFLQDIFTL